MYTPGQPTRYTEVPDLQRYVQTELARIADALSIEASPPFGCMTNDLNTAVVISAANTWEEIASGFVTGLVRGMTFAGAHYLSVVTPGRYLSNLSITLSSSNNVTVGAAVAINGMPQMAGHGHTTSSGPGDSISMSQSIFVDLAAGDQVSVAVVNHSGDADLTVPHCSLTLLRVGQ